MQQGYANNRYIIAKSHFSYLRALKKTGWETCLLLGLLESGRQDSNLRPSATKALDQQIATVPMRTK